MFLFLECFDKYVVKDNKMYISYKIIDKNHIIVYNTDNDKLNGDRYEYSKNRI